MGLLNKLAGLKDRFDGREPSKASQSVESSSPPVPAADATTSEPHPIPDHGSHLTDSATVEPTVEPSGQRPSPQRRVVPPEASWPTGTSPHQSMSAITVPEVTVAAPQVEPEVENTPEGAQNDLSQTPNDLSRELWDEAYVSIETDNKDLMKNYLAVLRKFLEKGKAEQISLADALEISAELNKKADRQAYMAKLVTSGKSKVEGTSKVSKVVGDIAGGILKLQPVIDVVMKVPQAAPAALPWAGVCVGLQMLANPKKATQANLEGMSHVVNRMEWYSTIVHHLLEPCSIDSVAASTEHILIKLRPKFVVLYTAVLQYQMMSICSYYRSQGFNFVLQLADYDQWESARKGVVDAEDELIKDWKMYDEVKARKVDEELVKINLKSKTLLGDISKTLADVLSGQKDQKTSTILSDLRVVNPLDDMARIEADKEKLQDDTFRWILEEDEFTHFTNWTDPSLPQRRLLWIKGDAGTGKTMLLVGIIRELSNRSIILSPKLSYFFCQSRGKTRLPLYSLTSTLRSLMWILVIQQPSLMSHLETEYHTSQQGLYTGDDAQQAVIRIFTKMLKDADPVCFVIDAFDECEEGAKAFIDLISHSLSISDKVRWLISSRREVKLLENLKRLNKKNGVGSEVLAELDIQIQKDRVQKYIRQKLTDLEENSDYPETYSSQILMDISKEMTKRADDNLLWACLVFQDLEKMTGPYALKNIVDYPRGLDKLYDHKMNGLKTGGTQYLDFCMDLLVTVSLAFRPLSITELAAFVSWSDTMDPRYILTDCKAFLALNNSMVTVVHKSASDYLTHQTTELRGGTIEGHAGIAKLSIHAMKSGLKQNIYDLKDYGFKSKDLQPPIPNPLELMDYHCVFWAEHLSSITYKDTEHLEQVMNRVDILTFLEGSLLCWFESLSLLGKLADGIRSMRKLQRVIQKHMDNSFALAEWFKDAEKFALSYGWIIAQAPLQTYAAALVFSPKLSQIKDTYWKDRLPFIEDVKGGRAYWSNLQQTFDPQRGDIVSLAYSPDSMTLASISRQGELNLWDALTSGTIIASVPSTTESVTRLWNLETGVLEQSLDHGSQGVYVFAVAFSPNSKFLATAASDKKIRLWHIETGTCEKEFDFEGSYQVIAFSTDGKLLAAAQACGTQDTADGSIKLWVVDGLGLKGTNPKGILKGHEMSVESLVFSPDQQSRMLASNSTDKTVRVWMTAECKSKHVLQHTGLILSVAFYRECQNLITAGYSEMWIWDLDRGSCTAVIGSISGVPSSIAFSSDTTTAAVASTGSSKIQLWDTVVPDQEQSADSGEYLSSTLKIDVLAPSPDGSMLALVCKDHIYIWDIFENACRTKFKHPPGYLKTEAVAFSSNSNTFVVVSLGGEVRLYGTAKTAEKPEKAIFQCRSRSRAVFARDQSAFAIILRDDSIVVHIYSTNSNTALTSSEDEVPGSIELLAFSPDCKKLAALSADKIQVWDAISGDHLETFPHSMDKYRRQSFASFAFSSDLTKFTTTPIGIVQLWDRRTDVVQKLSHGDNYLNSVIFSADGSMLAASAPREIIVWDVAEGASSVQQIIGVSRYENLISFSNDNSLLFTSSGALKIAQKSDGSSDTPLLFIQQQWIYDGSKALLWIPDEYRFGSNAAQDRMVVLKDGQGGFIVVNFVAQI